ncbi:PadR family transcriptional regulator [Timonella sp. A28]|uniref:PadR family transcriptional regulator n=1 Tax=Timonella sp. A28 TaxID=3442640 RepID=UPI003EB93EAF
MPESEPQGHTPHRHDPQLLKGVLPMLILAELAKQETHGYDLVQRLNKQGLEGLGQGTVYPLLTRLERDGCVTHQLVASSSGPARKTYAITQEGEREIARAKDAWNALNAIVTTLMK